MRVPDFLCESELINEFDYTLDSDEVQILFKPAQGDKQKVIGVIVSHFLNDLERTDTFSIKSGEPLPDNDIVGEPGF